MIDRARNRDDEKPLGMAEFKESQLRLKMSLTEKTKILIGKPTLGQG